MFAVIYTFHWSEKTNLKSLRNPHVRVPESLGKEKERGETDLVGELAIDDIIDQLSIDEKIGQLIFAGITGTTMTEETKSFISKYKMGGIILFANNLEDPQQATQLLNQFKSENEQNVLPLFLGVDQEGGRVERLPGLLKLPTNREIGAKNKEEFSYEVGKLLGKQLNAFGFNLNFAPVLDVNSNPNNPVIGDRSFDNDPEVVSKLGIQTMQGMKSQNIIPVVKHFPGHGDTGVDSHVELPFVNKSLNEMESLELIPFREAIEVGADVIMTAHILLPQIDDIFPSSMSEKVITGILREQLDFDRIVMTDDLTMRAITDNFDIGDAAVESIKAGTDIILIAHDSDYLISIFDTLKEAVENEIITEERINESLRRIIRVKREYNIDDKKVEAIDVEGLNKLHEKIIHND